MKIETIDGIRVIKPSEDNNVLYHKDDAYFQSPTKEVWLGVNASGDDWVESEQREPIEPEVTEPLIQE